MSIRTRRASFTAAAAALALFVGLGTGARADYAYGFASQSISGIRITGTTGGTLVSTSTTAAETLNGSGASNSAPLDTPQAYGGTPPAPPQNTFTKFATFPAGPLNGTQPTGVTTGALGNFARGDAVITSTDLFGATGAAAANVAEAYVNPGTATGNGGVSLTASFKTTATPAVAVTFNFSNDLYAATLGAGSAAQASYQFTFTVKNAAGAVVFESTTDPINSGLVNTTTGSPPNTPELLQTGSATINITGLAANQAYSITITSGAAVSVISTAVPAPTSIVMLGLGLGSVGLIRLRNRRVAG